MDGRKQGQCKTDGRKQGHCQMNVKPLLMWQTECKKKPRPTCVLMTCVLTACLCLRNWCFLTVGRYWWTRDRQTGVM